MKSVKIFTKIMEELGNVYYESPETMPVDGRREIALQLTRLEMEYRAKERQAESQEDTYELMAEIVKAYIETLKKPDFPIPLPKYPVFFPGKETEPSALDKATGVGESKNMESDAKPVPESQG